MRSWSLLVLSVLLPVGCTEAPPTAAPTDRSMQEALATPGECDATSARFYDDFERTSIGSDWTTVSGTWSIQSGYLEGQWPLISAQTDQANILVSAAHYNSGQWHACVLLTAGNSNGTFVFYNAAGHKYNIGFSQASREYAVEFRQGGTYTQVSSGSNVSAYDLSTDDVVAVTKDGTQFTLFVNGTQVAQFTDAVFNGIGSLGLGAYGTVRYSNFAVYDVSTTSLPGPNLRASLLVTPLDLGTGDIPMVQAEVFNTGSTAGGRSAWQLTVDGTVVASGLTPRLAPGDTVRVPTTPLRPGPFSTGAHVMTFIVDAHNGVTETDESDNNASAHLRVNALSPVPQSITFTVTGPGGIAASNVQLAVTDGFASYAAVTDGSGSATLTLLADDFTVVAYDTRKPSQALFAPMVYSPAVSASTHYVAMPPAPQTQAEAQNTMDFIFETIGEVIGQGATAYEMAQYIRTGAFGITTPAIPLGFPYKSASGQWVVPANPIIFGPILRFSRRLPGVGCDGLLGSGLIYCSDRSL